MLSASAWMQAKYRPHPWASSVLATWEELHKVWITYVNYVNNHILSRTEEFVVSTIIV